MLHGNPLRLKANICRRRSRRHQGCVEDVQCFVQVVVATLASHSDGLLNGDAQSHHAGDGQGTNHRADSDVDQDVGLPVAWAQYEDESYDDDLSCYDESYDELLQRPQSLEKRLL